MEKKQQNKQKNKQKKKNKTNNTTLKSLGGSVCATRRVGQLSFVETDREIFSMVTLSLLLIQ